MKFETRKLSAHPYAQACVKSCPGLVVLFSYETPVVEIRDGWLTVFGLYSATTRKHIGAFMKEYCKMTYQTAKQLYNDNLKMDLFTGEVVPV